MFDQFRTISRKRGRTLLAALVALIAAITGCDKKVAWRGVSTDRQGCRPVHQPRVLHEGNPPMATPDDPRPRGRMILPWLVACLLALAALGLVVAQAILLLSRWDLGIRDTRPTFSSSGPTMVQLERLQYLVSTRVHVADVLVGESRWLEGSWIIQGDALLAVDMAKAEIKDRNEQAKTAVIVLPQPAVLSGRVNHEKSQQWDIKSRSWIPLASLILGDRPPWRSRRCLKPNSSSSGWLVRTTTRRRPGSV